MAWTLLWFEGAMVERIQLEHNTASWNNTVSPGETMENIWDADYLGALAAFGAVADAGSFSEAARRLGTSKSALSKQVQRLEARLGSTLLHRTTRSLSLTEPGQLALEHAVQVARSAQAAAAAVESLTAQPRGLLRVTA